VLTDRDVVKDESSLKEGQ